MYHLIPYFIQQNFALGHMSGEFNAVGLFVDISGFSPMTEALMTHGPHGAEVLVEVMREVFNPLLEYVYGHKGIVIAIQGDSFTALFPTIDEKGEWSSVVRAGSHGNTLHAISAAAQIMEYMENHDQVKTLYGSFTIQVKVGLAAGDVRWGIVASKGGRRVTYYCQGASVDGCADAGNLAAAGEILCDEEIFKLVNNKVLAEQDGDYYRIEPKKEEILPVQPFDLVLPDKQILTWFFPEALLNQSSSGEFRQIVNVFIKLPTIRSEAQLSAFLDTLFDLTRRYGGFFKHVDFGDKGSNLLLFWGVPVTHENDIERALNFILDLQSMTSIPINAGITYQIAHAGFIRSHLYEEYTCYGWGLNLAARFMTSAKRGEIWVDEAVAEHARDHFEFKDTGEKTFKGFARKHRVFILLERKPEREPFFSGKMVGRTDEFNRLQNLTSPLWAGQFAGVVVIWGEAGVGKSRLVHEFQLSVAFREKTVLWALCQTDEILRQPLNPFQYWLYRYFKQSELKTVPRNKQSFNSILDELIEKTYQKERKLADELDRTRSFLGGLINLTWSDSLCEQLDPQGRNENIIIALISLIKAASLVQPMILILEDVHWLDEESRLLIPRLVRGILTEQNINYPIAIIATARSEAQRDVLGEGVDYEEIVLTGIPRHYLVDLAANRLGNPIAENLLDLLVERAGGNPFFTEHIISYLLEQDLIILENGEWRLSSSADLAPLPLEIRALLVSRLDRLASNVKNIVQAASAIGREFEYPLLVEMFPDENEIASVVKSATQSEIWKPLSDVRYLFKHSLLRDAAYSMMVLSRRKQFHAQIITAMESLYANDLREYYGELAFHSERADLPEKARIYLRQAGDLASNVYQNRLAETYYSRALALTPQDDHLTWFELVLEREALRNLLGDHVGQQHDLELIESILFQMKGLLLPEDWMVKKAVVNNRQSGFAIHTGDYQRAVDFAQEAFSLAQDAGAFLEIMEACLNWALALYRQAIYEPALELMEEAIELARQNEELTSLVKFLNMYGLIAMDCREPVSVSSYLEESRQIARETSNPRGEALALNSLGNLAGIMGDFSHSQTYYQQSLEIMQKIGHRRGEGLILGNLGWISGILGDYDASRAYCEQNLQINREAGSLEGEAYALINLSAACIYLGQNAQALSYLSQAMEIALQTVDQSAEAWTKTYMGHAQHNCDELHAAWQDYSRALEIRHELNQPNLAAEPLAGLARIALQRNDLSLAMQYAAEIMDYLDRGGTLVGCDEPLRVYLTCYQVLNQVNDPRASQFLVDMHNILLTRADKIQDESKRKSFLSNVPYHKMIFLEWQMLGKS